MNSTTDPATDKTARQKQGVFSRWRDAVQAEWKAVAASTAGKRFQERYQRKRDLKRPAWQKIVSPVVGVVILLLGVFLLPAPGPGIPIVLLGLALLAEHSLWVAKLLDVAEPPLRKLLKWGIHWWKHAPLLQRGTLIVLAVLLIVAVGAGLFVLLA